ncbi:MAG: PqqD family protein [Candidatus Levybacteria bacterium]|nr:PqqD family protein [Candidatus Levybacteria bacterium]
MKLKIQKGFITQRIGDKITIFDAEKSVLLTLNATATFIFDRLKKGIETKKIVIDLANKFDVSEKEAQQDIDDFIKTLIAKGLAKKENVAP